MTGGRIPNLLDKFPAVRSRNPHEVEEAIIGTYGARRLNIMRDSGLNVHANHWQSSKIGLSYCSYGGRVEVEFPAAKFFRLQISLEGGVQMRVDRTEKWVTEDLTSVIPPGTRLVNNFPENYKQLVVRIDADALASKLTALTGATRFRKLEFEAITPMHRLEGFRRLLMFFIGELESCSSNLPQQALIELEQALIIAFLCGNAHNHSPLLQNSSPQSVSAWQVRRAEEYIEAHWNEPITVEALAQATSTSVRSLFHHFKQSRGHSPMSFVKQVRLRHANRILTEPSSNGSVTDVAVFCGFSNLGHFARDYARQFGERPSETLNRAKGGKHRSSV